MSIVDINLPSFDIPNILDLGSNIIDVLLHLFDIVFGLLGGLFQALSSFYSTLQDVNAYVITLCESCKNNNLNSLPLIDIIGTYRYIVTEPVFVITYMLIIVGCFFTLYKLVILLIQAFNMIKNGVQVGKNTKISFVEYLKRKIFK